MKRTILLILMLMLMTGVAHSLEKFYQYYDKGLEYMEKGDWLRAIEEFKSAASLEFEDTKKMRTYGTRFIKYFPHREMGIAYYYLGELDIAKEELELSVAYKSTKEAEEYLEKIILGVKPDQDIALQEEIIIEEIEEKPVIEEKPKEVVEKPVEKKEQPAAKKTDDEKAPELAHVDINLIKKKTEEKPIIPIQKKEKEKVILEPSKDKVPVGALTYDPSKVTQVGSRLSIAVLPFETRGQASEFEFTLMEKLITQLVNLRRFRVIERGAMDEVMNEQALGMSGMVDEETAVEVGKLAGADVIVVGTINIADGFGKVSARGIDTETAETIVAQESQTGEPSMSNLESLVENVAILIYNALPLVEGYIVNADEDVIYLDIGSNAGIRKGTKCVAFREGDEIIHPITKEVLGTKVTMLGELIVTQVQEKLSTARILAKEGSIKIGDKVVIK